MALEAEAVVALTVVALTKAKVIANSSMPHSHRLIGLGQRIELEIIGIAVFFKLALLVF